MGAVDLGRVVCRVGVGEVVEGGDTVHRRVVFENPAGLLHVPGVSGCLHYVRRKGYSSGSWKRMLVGTHVEDRTE